MQIKCDMCNAEFHIDEASIRTIDFKPPETIVFGIKRIQFFSCPNCGYQYPIYLMDTVQEMYDRQIHRIRNYCDLRLAMDKSIPQSKIRQLKKTIANAQEHQDGLREQYLKTVTAQLNADYIAPKDNTETISQTGKETEDHG